MTNTILNLTTPPGRFVQGSLYKMNPRTDSATNQPKVGADGKPVMQCFFAIAIPKNPGEAAWWDTAWGKQILATGAAAHPQAYQRPDYAWKIEDGDSRVPNKRGRLNADREGFPGNWVIKFSSGFIPPLYTLIGQAKPAALLQENAIMPGAFIQVNFNAVSNAPSQSPGLYLNPQMVCLVGYGQPIVGGPDPDEAGFGGQPLPVGASMTPVASMGTVAAPPAPVAPAPAPAAPPAPVAPAPAAPAAPAAPVAPVPVQPHATILNPTGPVPAPPAPAPTPGRQMTAKAAGATYEQMVAAGWTDDTLRQHGYMV